MTAIVATLVKRFAFGFLSFPSVFFIVENTRLIDSRGYLPTIRRGESNLMRYALKTARWACSVPAGKRQIKE